MLPQQGGGKKPGEELLASHTGLDLILLHQIRFRLIYVEGWFRVYVGLSEVWSWLVIFPLVLIFMQHLFCSASTCLLGPTINLLVLVYRGTGENWPCCLI